MDGIPYHEFIKKRKTRIIYGNPSATTEVKFGHQGIPRYKWIVCNIIGNSVFEKLWCRESIWHKYKSPVVDWSNCLTFVFYTINMFMPSCLSDFTLILSLLINNFKPFVLHERQYEIWSLSPTLRVVEFFI